MEVARAGLLARGSAAAAVYVNTTQPRRYVYRTIVRTGQNQSYLDLPKDRSLTWSPPGVGVMCRGRNRHYESSALTD